QWNHLGGEGSFQNPPGYWGCQPEKAGHHHLGNSPHCGSGCPHHRACADTWFLCTFEWRSTVFEAVLGQPWLHSGITWVGRGPSKTRLAIGAANQKKQAITTLVIVPTVVLAVPIIVREWCWDLICWHEKPRALLKGRTTCCPSETVV
uniref:Uncharacterized protein n=1 Tax=Ursus americanus TaxID=9643 RepID=A0A452QAC1_URSAM